MVFQCGTSQRDELGRAVRPTLSLCSEWSMCVVSRTLSDRVPCALTISNEVTVNSELFQKQQVLNRQRTHALKHVRQKSKTALFRVGFDEIENTTCSTVFVRYVSLILLVR